MRLWAIVLVLVGAVMILVLAAGIIALNQDVPPDIDIKDIRDTSEPTTWPMKRPGDCRCDELPTPILPSMEDGPGTVAA